MVGETWDGGLNDVNGFHVRPEHVHVRDRERHAAARSPRAASAAAPGMVCHEFKGGIGTASRVIAPEEGGWTVGVLVQANYGRREWLRVDGVPVGEAIPKSDLPSPHDQSDAIDAARASAAATAVPAVLGIRRRTSRDRLDHHPRRHRRAAAAAPVRRVSPSAPASASHGWASTGGNYSGDLFLAWATGNRGLPAPSAERGDPTIALRMVADRAIDPLFDATIEATEEAIVNALVAADDDGRARRGDGARPAARPAARDDGPLRPTGTRDRMTTIHAAVAADIPAIAAVLAGERRADRLAGPSRLAVPRAPRAAGAGRRWPRSRARWSGSRAPSTSGRPAS